MIVQEAIAPTECVFKCYHLMGNFVIRLNNQIDFEGGSLTFEKEQVKKPVTRAIDDMEREVGAAFCAEMERQGFHNFGLDFVRRVDSDEFYFFDVNPDNFHWIKAFGDRSVELLRKGLISKFQKSG